MSNMKWLKMPSRISESNWKNSRRANERHAVSMKLLAGGKSQITPLWVIFQKEKHKNHQRNQALQTLLSYHPIPVLIPRDDEQKFREPGYSMHWVTHCMELWMLIRRQHAGMALPRPEKTFLRLVPNIFPHGLYLTNGWKLEDALHLAAQDLKYSSSTIQADLDRFQRQKVADLREMTISIARSHRDWCKKVLISIFF